jgi:hypothetical protein
MGVESFAPELEIERPGGALTLAFKTGPRVVAYTGHLLNCKPMGKVAQRKNKAYCLRYVCSRFSTRANKTWGGVNDSKEDSHGSWNTKTCFIFVLKTSKWYNISKIFSQIIIILVYRVFLMCFV